MTVPTPATLRAVAHVLHSADEDYSGLRTRYQVALERLYGDGQFEGRRTTRFRYVAEPFVIDSARNAGAFGDVTGG